MIIQTVRQLLVLIIRFSTWICISDKQIFLQLINNEHSVALYYIRSNILAVLNC
jgi:hypothetical protein